MAGHVRKRHKPNCAKRRDKTKRCNCDGSWQARIPDPNGRTNTSKIEKTFRTEREAGAWVALKIASQLDGTWIDPRQAERPFADVLAAWKESWHGRLSPTTERR